jgi:hypothetical protein
VQKALEDCVDSLLTGFLDAFVEPEVAHCQGELDEPRRWSISNEVLAIPHCAR